MAQYFPPLFTRAGLPPRFVRRIKIADLPTTDEVERKLADAARRRAPVDLYLARDLFLTKTVNIPYAARKEFTSAVALQIRQAMPGQAAGLVWRSETPVWRRGHSAEVSVYLLKDARLNELVVLVGPALRKILIEGVDAAPLMDNSRRTDRPERFWNLAVPVFFIVALGVIVGLQQWNYRQFDEQVAEAETQLALLRDVATQIRASADLRDAEFAAVASELDRFERESQPLALLADLTRVLDDKVWLSSFGLDGTNLRLEGFAEQDIAKVVSSVRSLPWVASVDLAGAVIVDAAEGEQRFQLHVNIQDTGGEP